MFRVANTVTALQSNTDRVNIPGSQRPRNRQTLVAGLLSYLHGRLVLWSAAIAIARERKMLLQCSEEQLRDMGITQAEAHSEAAREFFDVPGDRLAMNGLLDSGTRQSEATTRATRLSRTK